MQNTKYYNKLNHKLDLIKKQYGGTIENLAPEVQYLISCQLNSCKDIITFANTNKKTMDSIKQNIENIVVYFQMTDRDNRLVWNEYENTRNADTNYINFVRICKRLELVRLGINVSLVRRDINLTNDKIKNIRRLCRLGLDSNEIIHGLNNFPEDKYFSNMLFLMEIYNIHTPQHLRMIASRSDFVIEFINRALNVYRITRDDAIQIVVNFNNVGIYIADKFLNSGISADSTYNIVFNRFMNITTQEELIAQTPLVIKIISYKRRGFEDRLLSSLVNILNTEEKEEHFIRLISQQIPGTNIRLSQNIASDIIEYELSEIIIETIYNLIRNGIDQDYAYLMGSNYDRETIDYFFELVRTFRFSAKYAYMSIEIFNNDGQRINNIINYHELNGFSIEEAFTIERQFTPEMKQLIVQLIASNYPTNIIYGIMTNGDYNIDDDIDSDWMNIDIGQITENIAHINELRGPAFGFSLEQAYYMMHTPIENITLLRQHFNVENSYEAREFELDDIQLMIQLKAQHNFSEYYSLLALSNLNNEQINVMIELKNNNIEDEYCYRVAEMDNYTEEYKDMFLRTARERGSQHAFEFIEMLARD